MEGYTWTHYDEDNHNELYECHAGEDYLQIKRSKTGEKSDVWRGMVMKGRHSSGIHFISTENIKNCHDAEYVKRLVEECHKHSVYNAEQIESMGVI